MDRCVDPILRIPFRDGRLKSERSVCATWMRARLWPVQPWPEISASNVAFYNTFHFWPFAERSLGQAGARTSL